MGENSYDVSSLIAKLKSLNDPTIPSWALLLIECVCSVLTDSKDAKSLANRLTELENFKAVSEGVTENLKVENDYLRGKLEYLERRVDNDEQRSRNQCLNSTAYQKMMTKTQMMYWVRGKRRGTLEAPLLSQDPL